jgi:hypothetical protein
MKRSAGATTRRPRPKGRHRSCGLPRPLLLLRLLIGASRPAARRRCRTCALSRRRFGAGRRAPLRAARSASALSASPRRGSEGRGGAEQGACSAAPAQQGRAGRDVAGALWVFGFLEGRARSRAYSEREGEVGLVGDLSSLFARAIEWNPTRRRNSRTEERMPISSSERGSEERRRFLFDRSSGSRPARAPRRRGEPETARRLAAASSKTHVAPSFVNVHTCTIRPGDQLPARTT